MINLYHHFHKAYYEGFENIKVPMKNDRHRYIDGWLQYNNKGIDEDDKKAIAEFFKKKNKAFFDAINSKEKGLKTPNQFELKTTYPGLLMGSGYTKGIGAVGEFKLGFHLDYTTGLPIIPGTSIKGAIRSVFPELTRKLANGKMNYGIKSNSKKEREINVSKLAWMTAQIEDLLANEKDFLNRDVASKVTNASLIQIYKLTEEIFEGVNWKESNNNEIKLHSIYKRDIFHDAYPDLEKGSKQLFSDDSITPHKKKDLSHELSALTNPVPLLFLKISPNVQFKFSFDLKDGFWLTAKQKELLFQKILLEWGVGAKTNVGYGQFDLPSGNPLQRDSSNGNDTKKRKEAPSFIETDELKVGNELMAILVQTGATKKAQLLIKEKHQPIVGIKFHVDYPVGTKILVKVTEMEKGKPLSPKHIKLVRKI